MVLKLWRIFPARVRMVHRSKRGFSSMSVNTEGSVTLKSSAQTATNNMSVELRETLYRQLAANVGQYGKNVRVALPSGDLANEMRKLSLHLLNAGVVLRGSRYVGTLQRSAPDVFLIFHPVLVDELLRKPEALPAIRSESQRRLRRFKDALHQRLSADVNVYGSRAVVLLHINDAVSVVDVGASFSRLFGNHREPVESKLDAESLRIIRHVIVPYYEEHAEVEVVFEPDNPERMTLTLNRMPVVHH